MKKKYLNNFFLFFYFIFLNNFFSFLHLYNFLGGDIFEHWYERWKNIFFLPHESYFVFTVQFIQTLNLCSTWFLYFSHSQCSWKIWITIYRKQCDIRLLKLTKKILKYTFSRLQFIKIIITMISNNLGSLVILLTIWHLRILHMIRYNVTIHSCFKEENKKLHLDKSSSSQRQRTWRNVPTRPPTCLDKTRSNRELQKTKNIQTWL